MAAFVNVRWLDVQKVFKVKIDVLDMVVESHVLFTRVQSPHNHMDYAKHMEVEFDAHLRDVPNLHKAEDYVELMVAEDGVKPQKVVQGGHREVIFVRNMVVFDAAAKKIVIERIVEVAYVRCIEKIGYVHSKGVTNWPEAMVYAQCIFEK